MSITLSTPTVSDLERVLAVLRSWQADQVPIHLHLGDVGWYAMRGAARTAAALRIWAQDGDLRAIGLLDGPDVLRLAVDPHWGEDEELAGAIAEDLRSADGGALPEGDGCLEARSAPRLRTELARRGWTEDEPWVPLHRDLEVPVESPALRVETVALTETAEFTAVHRSAFTDGAFTDERMREMAAGPGYRAARSLLGRDADGRAVAMATVWSAGPGRPGLLEPLAVHADHRRRGYGREITLAAAAALREMGASSARVCTERERAAAVATYVSAGFERFPESRDLCRPRGRIDA